MRVEGSKLLEFFPVACQCSLYTRKATQGYLHPHFVKEKKTNDEMREATQLRNEAAQAADEDGMHLPSFHQPQ